MAKAMLIMDMPTKCTDCDFFARGTHDKPICILCTENCADYLYTKQVYKTIPPSLVNEKPDWCPLREVPQKKIPTIKNRLFDVAKKLGYNACIDEILGGGE